MDDAVRTSAKLDTGHVKIMTRAYEELSSQAPNDLALMGISTLLPKLKKEFPGFEWAARIKFGGLMDFPDENGETKAQGPVFGMALDMISPGSRDLERINLKSAIVRGRLPRAAGEMMLSEKFVQKLGVAVGDTGTLIGSTANGGMAIYNFTLVGTINLGIGPLDRNTMFADLTDIRYALDMEDAAGEVLGFFPNMVFNQEAALTAAARFNADFSNPSDEFSPIMLTLRDQGGFGELLDTMERQLFVIIFAFVFVMSIVLWNTGLMSGLRRYGEMGVRLAFGESKGHVYWSLIYEAILTGLVGSILGSAIGLAVSLYIQEKGFDFSSMMRGSNVLMSSVMRTKVTPVSYFIGFVPRPAGHAAGDRHFRHRHLQAQNLATVQGAGNMRHGLAILLTFLLTVPAWAQALTGNEILVKIDENMAVDQALSTTRMVIHGRTGSRTIEARTWIKGHDRTLVEYLAPAREKGKKMLKLGDKIWNYTPEPNDRIITISGHLLRQSVMGSDLSYEDITENDKWDEMYEATIQGREQLFGRDCLVLLLTAKKPGVTYHTRKVWVDSERWLPLQEERFARSGRLLKKTTIEEVLQADERWYPKKMTIKDMLSSGQGTEYYIDSIDFNAQVPDSKLTKAALRQ